MASRKVNVRGKRQAAAKAAPAKKAGVIFTPEKGAPYKALAKDRAVFSAFTIAVLGATGFLRINKASVTPTGKGDLKAFGKAAGSAKGYWVSKGLVSENGLSKDGLVKVQTRLDPESRDSYRTSMKLVNEVHGLLKGGGTLKTDAGSFPFATPVEVA